MASRGGTALEAPGDLGPTLQNLHRQEEPDVSSRKR